MSVATAETAESRARAKTTFFRQSGWMMFAGVAAGGCYFSVHFFSKAVSENEYGAFATLLAIFNLLSIPGLALQMIFTQQTSAAITPEEHRRLTGTTRRVLLGTFGLWLGLALALAWFQQDLLAQFKMSSPVALWITLCLGLGQIWTPIFSGLLQGQQNFLWLGWSSMLGGVGRLAAVAVIVLLLHNDATGMIAGALVGLVAPLCVLIWHSRGVWLRGTGAPIAWRPWLARVLPLTLGFGAYQFLFCVDALFVRHYFGANQSGPYMGAGTLARAIALFTGPLSLVMFPKIVRSVARAEKTDIMKLALPATAGLACLAAFGLSVVAPWILPFVFKQSFLVIRPLLPWFAWSMVPLAVANVLINNLLARGRFAVVPWLVLVAAGYGVALTYHHDSFLTVIRILGLFNLLAMVAAAWHTWRKS
jgi:O-antigen/teichoic acid export membrane protein